MFNSPPLGPPRPSDPKSGEYFWEHRMYIPCEFSVDRPTRFRDMDYVIFPHWPQCKNSTPRPRGPHGPIIPELPRSRPWCLLYPEPKFHADRTILRWDILNRTNKQKQQTSYHAKRYAVWRDKKVTESFSGWLGGTSSNWRWTSSSYLFRQVCFTVSKSCPVSAQRPPIDGPLPKRALKWVVFPLKI